MKTLAAWIMRGPTQAAALAASALLVGLVLPPFVWLSAAIIALVVLCAGTAGAVRAVVPALLVAVGGGWLATGSPQTMALVALASWLPVLLVAGTLRATIRLDLALLAAVGLGWSIVLGIHAVVADAGAMWQELLTGVMSPAQMAEDLDVDAERMRELVEQVAPLMTGFVATSTVVSSITATFLARWWQAGLYNPGGFREEFHGLRLGQTAAMVTAGIMALAAFTESALIFSLALVACSVYVIQGIAVIHGVVSARQMLWGWLGGMYVLTVVLFLQMALALIVVGIIDAWADLRRRGAGPAN